MKIKKGYIYKIIINDPNSSLYNKYYIGRCSSRNINKYWGSGKIIKDYIKTNGTYNLTKVIIEEAEENLLDDLETHHVGDLWYTDINCLNLRPGGNGHNNPKGKRAYNNGTKVIMLSDNEKIPKGFTRGRGHLYKLDDEVLISAATNYMYKYKNKEYRTKELFMLLVEEGLLHTKNINMSTGNMGRIIRNNMETIGVIVIKNYKKYNADNCLWDDEKRNKKSKYKFKVNGKMFYNSKDLYEYLGISDHNWNRLRWLRTNRKDVEIIKKVGE